MCIGKCSFRIFASHYSMNFPSKTQIFLINKIDKKNENKIDNYSIISFELTNWKIHANINNLFEFLYTLLDEKSYQK
jgi:hypothetical protein